MTTKEAIETIKMAKAEVEWSYPMDYQVAFDMGINALQKISNIDLQELRDRFGKEVAYVVADMISGKNER